LAQKLELKGTAVPDKDTMSEFDMSELNLYGEESILMRPASKIGYAQVFSSSFVASAHPLFKKVSSSVTSPISMGPCSAGYDPDAISRDRLGSEAQSPQTSRQVHVDLTGSNLAALYAGHPVSRGENCVRVMQSKYEQL
jgi:hypothetical protein